ncbi:osmoprotectant transport system substrate-binding protein [Atopostipes suicloacalis DSM 15692]|uniref:Osmoprotectant transport system substrate-binding protein n=1 Tax=Atopostipes suicloacalis DSM 15692 TaxID=1121025 RepID=A0A1M4Y7N6_9LACT|nr:osmoprotectant ABC transporter substrate-binding protein [Atopostipes suicloacalis]SHF01679.1 osmoprotectant transport system substrate-binding protein [Atopostipes suicloacalis DSM 15692]
MHKFTKKLIITVGTLTLLTGCALPGLGGSVTGEGISITGGTSTEMDMMGYLIEGMVEHYIDTDANVITNLSSGMNHQAFLTGDANVSGVRYTGTSLTGELNREAVTDPEEAERIVVEAFEEEYNHLWYPSYGFSNSYAFIVREETAEEYGLEKVSQLEEYKDEFSIGVDTNWMTREGDGYDEFVEIYGFEFNDIFPMSLGLLYTALSSEEIDVGLGYSTDGQIPAENLVLLEDDLNLFPPYDASPLATAEIVEKYPELEGIFLKLEDQIDEEQMQELNYLSENYLLEPRTVIFDWLEQNNFFEDVEPYLEPIEGGLLPND